MCVFGDDFYERVCEHTDGGDCVCVCVWVVARVGNVKLNGPLRLTLLLGLSYAAYALYFSPQHLAVCVRVLIDCLL